MEEVEAKVLLRTPLYPAADAVDLPMVIYNIPGRTGKNIENSTMLKLAGHWFAPTRFAMLSGLALACGILGAVSAGVPLTRAISTMQSQTESKYFREVLTGANANGST